jgi:hypothetical protein
MINNRKSHHIFETESKYGTLAVDFFNPYCLRNASQIRVHGGQRNNAHVVATTQLRIVHHGSLPPQTSTSYAVLLENSSHCEKLSVLVLMIMIHMGHHGMHCYLLDFWRNCVGWL